MSKTIVKQSDDLSEQRFNVYKKLSSLQQSINALKHYSDLGCESDDDYSIKRILANDIQAKFKDVHDYVLFQN